MSLFDYFPQFIEALRIQMVRDQVEHQDNWKNDGGYFPSFEEYMFYRIASYYKAWKLRGEAIPWTKIAAWALIGWARSKQAERKYLDN